MGAALARAFLAAGHPTSVWNRTAARAEALGRAGATTLPDPVAAFGPGRLAVLCVLDPAAARDVLDAAGPALVGSDVVNLTSSTPEAARELADAVTARGARYLDGTIMVPTPLVGTPDALVLYSGDRAVLDDHGPTLSALGGELDWVGEDPGRAATFDLGMLDVFFSAMTSFLHASALVAADGVSAERFRPYADQVLDVLKVTFAELAAEVDAGEHPGTADNLVMNGTFLEHIVATSRARGLDERVPQLSLDLVHAAIGRGHGADGYSRIVDELRRRAG
jgi:3-hydroxyisobutyrate dehydrogenase-like beta-hydroxyacid dehydrogenase